MNISAPDILLVEDSPTSAELFVFALEANQSSATIQVVRDGVEALDFLLDGDGAVRSGSTSNALPRLVLLDLHMPRLDGFQVLERLRADERTRLLPVVILSSSDQESDKREAFRLGANGYISTPVGFKNSCEIIARLEREWLGAAAAPQLPPG